MAVVVNESFELASTVRTLKSFTPGNGLPLIRSIGWNVKTIMCVFAISGLHIALIAGPLGIWLQAAPPAVRSNDGGYRDLVWIGRTKRFEN